MTDTWERIHDAALTRHEDGGAELARLVIEADDLFQSLAKRDARMKAEGVEIAREAVWDYLNGSQLAEQVCDAILARAAAIRAEAETKTPAQS